MGHPGIGCGVALSFSELACGDREDPEVGVGQL